MGAEQNLSFCLIVHDISPSVASGELNLYKFTRKRGLKAQWGEALDSI
jgi:hypothetical protein